MAPPAALPTDSSSNASVPQNENTVCTVAPRLGSTSVAKSALVTRTDDSTGSPLAANVAGIDSLNT